MITKKGDNEKVGINIGCANANLNFNDGISLGGGIQNDMVAYTDISVGLSTNGIYGEII